jgi:hypothetical protein
METYSGCGDEIKPNDPSRVFVWLGASFDPYGSESKPDLRVHERCLATWEPPDPYYHDTGEPFPDFGM